MKDAIKARQNERQLQECDRMLTDAGVPEWVMISANEPVPANSTPERLKWYLLRRKNVEKWETDQKLQREMTAWESPPSESPNVKGQP
jgi:hypothetical protein